MGHILCCPPPPHPAGPAWVHVFTRRRHRAAVPDRHRPWGLVQLHPGLQGLVCVCQGVGVTLDPFQDIPRELPRDPSLPVLGPLK